MEDFELESEIGSGGFGKVYRASVLDGGRFGEGVKQVAIKITEKSRLKNEALRARLAAEVGIHSQLHHESIVKLYDFFEDEKQVYLIMELCEQGDMYEYLKKRNELEGRAGLSEEEIRGIMLQLGRGIAYLHKLKIIHRDLKLKNLVINNEMEVKIIDFGLATQLNNEPITFCGTQNYISPEVMERKPYGLAADMWALGCLMVTFLRGKQPSEKELNDEGRIVSGLKRLGISDEAVDLTKRLLVRDPNSRISISNLFNHPFLKPILGTRNLKRLSSKKSGYAVEKRPQYSTIRGDTDFIDIAENVTRARGNGNRSGSGSDIVSKIKNLDINKSSARLGPTKDELIVFNTKYLAPFKQKTKYATIEIISDKKIKAEFHDDKKLLLIDPIAALLYIYPAGTAILTLDKALARMRLGYSYINSATTERQVRYVYRFVELVLSKTSKIVVKSSKAKAMFMMNEPVADLVVDFFNKIKVTYSATKKILEIKIPSTSDLPDELHRLPLSASSSSLSGTKSLKFPENVPSKLSAVVAHVKKLYSICQSVENIALGFEQKTDPRCYDYTGSVTYPIVVSSNVNLDTFVPPSLSKKLLSAFSKPITSTSLSASNSTFTVNGHHSSYKPEIPSFPHKAVSLSNINGARSIVDKESDKRYNYCHIPKIGWCIAHSLPPNLSSADDDRYLFTILFNDGSRLQVDSATDIIVYHDPDNHCTTAKMGLELPSFMKSRLKQLPLFLNVLGF